MRLRIFWVYGSVVLAAIMLAACGGSGSETPETASVVQADEEAVPAEVPEAMRACYECHEDVVTAYLEHGMARSIGPVGTPAPGAVTNPFSGTRYEIYNDAEGAWLKGTNRDGGTRYQRLVGRVGAGLFDTSWIGAEVDPFTNENTGRLFFAPVETIVGHGLELSPFELREGSAGLDLPLNQACLTCHTTDRLAGLPNAAVGPDGRAIYPDNALGIDAFEILQPLGCEACHGDARDHVTMMSGLPGDDAVDIESLSRSSGARQRDVCARCHLQGDARLDLVEGVPRAEAPLAGQIPVLVPTRAGDDFRFVGQLERLALSACFKATPAMTCTTCHDAHTGVAQQGTARFDAACKSCHAGITSHTTLTVEAVTGEPARTAEGCVDCHVRRSQPFDLPHIRTADHFIRRRIPEPAADLPHRQFADPAGPVTLFDDGRLAERLRTPEGRRWNDGVVAVGLVSMGRMEEAVQLFESFPQPGTEAAVQPSAPDGLISLEADPSFHHTRGIALMIAGRRAEALAAFSDALKLDPYYAEARMERAKLRLLTDDIQGALIDTRFVVEAHPEAERPWKLNTSIALSTGRVAMAASALETATQRWPSDAASWQQLAFLYDKLGRRQEAQQALARAQLLQPSIQGFEPVPPVGR